jgi:Tfp pilus assembly protein PilN
MRAVNLVPSDRGGGGVRSATPVQASIYVLIGFLAGVLGLVTLYVLAQNKLSAGQAQLAAVQQQASQEQSLAARLTSYTQFATLAGARVATVQGIAGARFDWHLALADLAKVVPPTIALQTFAGTVAPGATAGTSGSGVGASAGLRSQVATPAVEISGCGASQDDVARLMADLRVMDGVTRVTLGASQKSDTSTGSDSGQGCPPGKPAFDLVVFYSPLPAAGPTGVLSVSAPTATGSSATPVGSAPTSTPGTSSAPPATPGASSGAAPQ